MLTLLNRLLRPNHDVPLISDAKIEPASKKCPQRRAVGSH